MTLSNGTMAEKVFSEKTGEKVDAGGYVFADVDLAMIHDVTGPLAIEAMKKLSEKVWDKGKVVLLFDHQVPADSFEAAENQRELRSFAEAQSLENFLGEREGVCHQVVPEKGFVSPGDLVVGADSHTCTYGALGAFATGLGSTDAGAVLATGELWFKVPETFKFVLKGSLPGNVYGKDVILNLIGELSSRGAIYKALEFHGPVIESMGMAGRFTLCNMAVEMGAKTGMVPSDEVTAKYLEGREADFKGFGPGSGASYEKVFEKDLSGLVPQISKPHEVDNVFPVSEVEGVSLDQVFIGSCTNGRFDDLKVAASFLEGKKVSEKVRVIVTPASREIYLEALEAGLLKVFSDAGCIVQNPCCGPCMGSHTGLIASGEVSLSTSNRNFKGRQGSSEGEIYLSSPATAAVSAVKGKITEPESLEN